MEITKDGRPVLSLAEIEAFDPQGPPLRRWCPLCGEGKAKDAAHRSLSLDRSTGKWKCFRCNAGGLLREFWSDDWKGSCKSASGETTKRRTLRRSFGLSSEPLVVTTPPVVADSQSNPVASNQPSAQAWRQRWESCHELSNSPGAAYLENRGIGLDVALQAGVRFTANWSGHVSVVFPIHDRQGRVVAAQARALRGTVKLTSGPKKEGAFFAPVKFASGRVFEPLEPNAPAIILTEAPIDALSLAMAGFPALALCGTTGPHWLHIACGLRRVALALDEDDAGSKAALELEKTLIPFGAKCLRLEPDGAKDWNEMLLQSGLSKLGDYLAQKLL